MVKPLLTCAKVPCISCPYRTDVPSGVWTAHEYDKLPTYDGSIVEQLEKGATGVFMCHQGNDKLCAGWVATHKPSNLLALRHSHIAVTVWDYTSPVPVFASGADAAKHGKRDLRRPSRAAREMMLRIMNKRPDIQTKERDTQKRDWPHLSAADEAALKKAQRTRNG